MDVGQESMPVSRINLIVDSERYYTAGDDSGSTIECECPWGTQAMADDILSAMNGYVYRPYNGEDALLDPAAELGDGITVGGLYSTLAIMGRKLDRQALATVGAPESDEIDDEYPYKSKTRRKTDRMLANLRSTITKTASEIRLEVEGLNEEYTELAVTLQGVTIKDENGQTLIKGSSIDTGSLAAESIQADALFLGGDMTIYQSLFDDEVGGYLGYTESALDGSAGMHMASQEGLAEVVVTDRGAKLLCEDQQVYVSSDAMGIEVDGQEYLHIYGLTSIAMVRGAWDFSEATVTGLLVSGMTAVFA